MGCVVEKTTLSSPTRDSILYLMGEGWFFVYTLTNEPKSSILWPL